MRACDPTLQLNLGIRRVHRGCFRRHNCEGMRILTTLIALLYVCACGVPSKARPAVRLTTGRSDTVIVNNRRATPLPIQAVDAAGRAVTEAPIRYAWTGGDSLPVDTAGTVTCTRAGDVVVRVSLGHISARVFVRCRPVEYLRFPGPVQFILGDSAMNRPLRLPVTAYGPDGQRVVVLAGSASVHDTAVAILGGLTLYPRSRGITATGVYIGGRAAWTGVHIYQRVDTLAALDTLMRVAREQRLVAVPLRLESGEFTRQRLPPGGWMLTMLPEEDHDPNPIRLRVEGAACQANILNTPRRFVCWAGPTATVIIYRPFSRNPLSAETGYLLVRPVFG